MKWFIALERFLVKMITRKRSGKDLKSFKYILFLPRHPISRLFRVDSLVVFTVSEVFQTIKNHDNAAVSTASAVIPVSVTSIHLGLVHSTSTTASVGGANGIANEIEAPGKIYTQLIVDDVD